MNIYEQIKKNNISTWLILTAFMALLLGIGMGFDYFYGAGIRYPLFTIIAFVIAVISSYSSYMYGDQLVLSSTHAREPNPDDIKEKQWQDVVEEMSVAAGLPMPQVYVTDDPDPNAFATGRDPAHSSIVATRGLLDILNREELQAVASHEMSHIRNYDTRLLLIVAVLVGSVTLLAGWAGRMFYWGRGDRDRRSGGAAALVMLVIWLVAVILAPILSRLIAMCVSRKREYLADASGAELTRNPTALADALEKINSHYQPSQYINEGTSHLCIADPQNHALGSQEGWLADIFATHPPIQKRIEILKQMAYK
jgi:heat shock protein HtpX